MNAFQTKIHFLTHLSSFHLRLQKGGIAFRGSFWFPLAVYSLIYPTDILACSFYFSPLSVTKHTAFPIICLLTISVNVVKLGIIP